MSQAAANPLDPKALLEQAFEMEDEFPGPAEDLLLSWLLSLGADQAPASAAAALLPRFAERIGHQHDARDLGDDGDQDGETHHAGNSTSVHAAPHHSG